MSNTTKRKLINLRYRMRQQGYKIDDNTRIVVLPIDGSRCLRREKEINKLGYDLQKNMFHD